MKKHNKGRIIIRSIEELTSLERRRVARMANSIGVLMVLTYFLLLLCYFGLPNLQWFSSLDAVSTLLFLCLFSVCPFLVGRGLGVWVKLTWMGYAFPKVHYSTKDYRKKSDNSFSSSSSNDTTNHFHSGSNYSSSPSINPSSGLPMAGSSGIDTRGNPYGSNSW